MERTTNRPIAFYHMDSVLNARLNSSTVKSKKRESEKERNGVGEQDEWEVILCLPRMLAKLPKFDIFGVFFFFFFY